MALTLNPDTVSVFVDSSVLFAAFMSPSGHANDLLIAAAEESIELTVSGYILAEIRKNLQAKVPAALPLLSWVESQHLFRIVNPLPELVSELRSVVVEKDAPIVAGAIASGARMLATFDRKHLVAEADLIAERWGIRVMEPGDIIRELNL